MKYIRKNLMLIILIVLLAVLYVSAMAEPASRDFFKSKTPRLEPLKKMSNTNGIRLNVNHEINKDHEWTTSFGSYSTRILEKVYLKITITNTSRETRNNLSVEYEIYGSEKKTGSRLGGGEQYTAEEGSRQLSKPVAFLKTIKLDTDPIEFEYSREGKIEGHKGFSGKKYSGYKVCVYDKNGNLLASKKKLKRI